MNETVSQFVKKMLVELTPINAALRTREEADQLALQMLGAVSSIMLGPHFAARKPTRKEAELLMPKFATAAFNAMLGEMKKHSSSNWN